MALRAVTLGYANERVDQAAVKEITNGLNLTRPSLTELEAAELMVDLIPGAEMVKFAKNGSNVTTAALKIARAYTGKKFVCIPRQHPFFSFDDWFIGTTPLKRGIPEEYYSLTLVFDYGDIDSLKRLFDGHPGDIAAVMLEPATTVLPCSPNCTHSLGLNDTCKNCPYREGNFLQKVQKLCRREKALFILDEMITGFRFHLQGAQTFFGVDPDMSTFGKAMANGFAVSALVGKRDVMSVGGIKTPGMERTFLLSTTHGAEMVSLGAFIETVKIYKELRVVEHLWDYGRKLFVGIEDIAKSRCLGDFFQMDGSDIIMNYVTKDSDGNMSLPFRTLFSQEMVSRGIMMPWIAVSLAHSEIELDSTLSAVEWALKVYKEALDVGVERFLMGGAIKPVFRRFN